MKKFVAIVGGGPAGLIAAEILSAEGVQVRLYERMPSMGRKLLMAGRGGLNLTHSEPFETLVTRYGAAGPVLRPMLEAFPPQALMAWAEGLGQSLFTGSSGRVFPKAMKASPLLRAWLARLRAQGVEFETRHEWLGWDEQGGLVFRAAGKKNIVHADCVILALGGASWPKLGSRGGWAQILREHGVSVTPFRPANCGFAKLWSNLFRARFAGMPLKNAAFGFAGHVVHGEAVITDYGIEGGAIYALSAALRDALDASGTARLTIDLRPSLSRAQLEQRLNRPLGRQTLSNFLRKAAALSPLEINLLRETDGLANANPATLARAIKEIPVMLTASQPIARAISSSGGVAFSSLDEGLMAKAMPGCFVAGEMLDWEAPTGGYLLQACFATGVRAAGAALNRLHVESNG